MSLVRRALVALGIMMGAAAAIRLGGRQPSPRVVGGWRPLEGPWYR